MKQKGEAGAGLPPFFFTRYDRQGLLHILVHSPRRGWWGNPWGFESPLRHHSKPMRHSAKSWGPFKFRMVLCRDSNRREAPTG